MEPAQGYAPGPAPGTAPQGNGLAIAGLVLGLLGLLLCWVPFLGWLLAILGIIFGAIGVSKAKRVQRGKGMALAGLITGVAGLVIGVILFVLAMQAVERRKAELREEFEQYERSRDRNR